MSKSYTPTESMKNNARRGLAFRDKYNRGGLDAPQAKEEGVGSGVARARDIINGNLSLDTVKRMYSFLSRAETYYKPKERKPDGGPTAGTIAYLEWGGPAALSWARKILKEEGIVKSYVKEITEDELNKEEVLRGLDYQIQKSTNEDLMQATFVVMVPDEVDLHGDITSEEEVRKAKESFNKHCGRANLFHKVMTDSFSIIESYLSPVDFILNEKFIKKGTWLCTIQCHEEKLWRLIKSGEICSVSIGALARVEELDEETEVSETDKE